jgi:hypothetical protein
VLLVEDSVLVLVVMLMIVVELLLTLDELCHGPITPHPLSISTLNSRTYLARLSLAYTTAFPGAPHIPSKLSIIIDLPPQGVKQSVWLSA